MKLSEAVKCYEECFDLDNSDGAGGCLYENCPLHEEVTVISGDPSDVDGQTTWKIGGCSLLSKVEEWLEDKTPGVPYPEED